ncbi:MAG: protein kinase [Myxococcales bacterium]|nr:protein kinase [Myxococcales bacterium]
MKLFLEAGATEDAARVLGGPLKRPRDAGQLLLESLGVQPSQAGQLDSGGKKRALMAAIFLGKAGENELAVQLFMALGEQGRAVELLQRSGDTAGAARLSSMRPGQFETGPILSKAPATAVGGQALSVLSAQKLEEQGKWQLALESYAQLKRFGDAARMATALKKPADAAQLYAEGGLPFESAECYLEAGDTGKALDNLCRVPKEDPRYRTAAARAVRLATNLGVLDFRLEHFLGPYVKSGARDAEELAVFDLLARLYISRGYPENAREVLQKMLDLQPGHAGARERLSDLDAEIRPSAMVARQVLEHADLHRRKSLPDLPDLGDLPGMEATMMRHDPELVAQAAQRVAGTATQPEEVLAEAEVIVEPEQPIDKFAAGSTIASRYRLEAQIGKGGMAAVFRAWDLELEEQVALKVFNLEQTSDVAVARFKQELKLSRQLIHPNIIRLYDIGMHHGHRYISMELLTGQSLKDRMARSIDFRTAIGYLVQACHGLQAAHDAGVVHRDVKPDNFFVTNDGVLKVMDFGIAKQHATPGVTVAGSIAGTPMYMSPEQISSFSTVTHLTDVYALGVCAYELFTGKVPFNHPELVPLLMMHVNNAPQPPRARNPGIPLELEAVILKALAKDPRQRFHSCREMSEALVTIRDRYAA